MKLFWPNVSAMVMKIGCPDSTPVTYIINDKWSYNAVNKIVVQSSGTTIALRAKTADVLNLLIASNQEVVSSERFINSAWGGRYVSENVLKQSIREIRAAFDDVGKNIVRTAPKKGYWLAAKISLRTTSFKPLSEIEKTTKIEVIDGAHNNLALQSLLALAWRGARSYFKAGGRVKWGEGPVSLHSSTKNQHFLKKYISSEMIAVQAFVMISVAFIMMLLLGLFFANYLSLITENGRQKIQLDEYRSYVATIQTVSSRYYHSTRRAPVSLLEILDRLSEQALDPTTSLAKQKGRLDALYQFHQMGGYYQESRLLLETILGNAESLYGKHSVESLSVKFKTIQTLMNLHQPQDAYDLSRDSLQLAIEYHEDNRELMADAYYVSASAFLYCVEPFCKREKNDFEWLYVGAP